MVPQVITKITALEAVAAANLFLRDHLPDRYCAGDPTYAQASRTWLVPVLISYLHIGPLGQVGEIIVNGNSEAIISHTPLDEMRSQGRALYEQHREAIEAAFLQARNA